LRMEWLRTPGMIYWRRNLEAFVHAVNDDGALPVLVVQTTLAKADNTEELRSRIAYRWVQLDHANLLAVNDVMADVMRQVAAATGTPLIDLRNRFNGVGAYFADHVHLTHKGSAALAQAVAIELAPVLHERGCRRS
jgi:lysophospholipase L1-like esterase